MRKDYRGMQEDLLPGKETREWMWEAIEEKAAKRKKKREKKRIVKWACGIAAAVFVCILCIPQTGLAEGMRDFFHKFLFVDMDQAQEVIQNVYEDQDGHVRMQVQEMLSDGACMYFNICYEALDEEGKEWLAEYNFAREDGGWPEIRFAYIGNDYVGGSYDFAERRSLATDTKRYFTFYQRDQGEFKYDNVKQTLFYPLYHKQGIGVITLKSNLDVFAYRLVGEGSPSEYYVPKYLKASKLSFGIYGENRGAFVEEKDSHGGLIVEPSNGYVEECETHGDEMENGGTRVVFYMKDGTKIPIDSYINGIIWEEWPDKPVMDKMCIAASHYYGDGKGGSGKEDEEAAYLINLNLMVDPEDMEGIEINGAYYGLEPCEMPEGY